jgi:S1-C subfamily serine protease
MANKVIIGILILLVILIGGAGYYSYTLNQQIDDLSEQLTAFETEQTARVDSINDELITLRTETLNKLRVLDNRIEESQDDIDALEKETEVTQNQVAAIEDEIGGVASQVDALEDSITDAVAKFSRSVIDTGKVYEVVSQATVRINDGQKTVGSGIIFDTEGHVVTAYHVIDGLSNIYVILPDGRVSKATTIGQCEFSDIAALKLEDNPGIEPPPWTDSSQVQVGEPVVAIGSPFDLRDTLTAGIISQVNRLEEIQFGTERRSIANLLQFDAAVNSGNSGCPLANSDGEIIGVVVARIQPTEGDGIYYAVASNKVKRVVAALIEQGSFDYPWIGVGIADLTPQIVLDMALETANGVLVSVVYNNTPAEAAGIETDDIVVSIDDVLARDTSDLTSYLGEYKSPGDTAVLGIIRDTKKIELSIEVGKRQE